MTTFQTALDTVLTELKRIPPDRASEMSMPSDLLAKFRECAQPAAPQPPAPQTVGTHGAAVQEVPSVTFGGRSMEDLRSEALACVKCPSLAASRKNVVFGVGDPKAHLMFVGEAPGADEDTRGEPFVGKAGELLTKMILAMGYTRERVYIANVLKCRPDTPGQTYGNRPPTPEEMARCLPYLREQIALIKPAVIVALGATAMNGLFGESRPMNQVRGRWHAFDGIPVMATYHPAYLLHVHSKDGEKKAIAEKRKVWEDMLLVLERLGDPISAKQRGYFLPK